MQSHLLFWARRAGIWSAALLIATAVAVLVASRSASKAIEYGLLVAALGGSLGTLDYRRAFSVRFKSKRGVSVWLLSFGWGIAFLLAASIIGYGAAPIALSQVALASGLSLAWSLVGLAPVKWLGRSGSGHAP
jgi:hypothetical protein